MNELLESLDGILVWSLIVLLGLIVGFLLAQRIFGIPKVKEVPRHRCCGNFQWESLADLGEAAGCDFELGRCLNCGTHLMSVFYVASTTYNVISDRQAEYFLDLQGKPALKKALKNWIG